MIAWARVASSDHSSIAVLNGPSLWFPFQGESILTIGVTS